MRPLRLILAFLLAPLLPAILERGYFMLNAPAIGPPVARQLGLDPGITRMAYLVAILLGVPTYFLLRKRLRAWWHFAICGGLLGAIPALFMDVFGLGAGGFDVIAFVIGAPCGLISGFSFWLIGLSGIRRSPVGPNGNPTADIRE